MPRRDRRTARLWLERLEDRLAPATFSISGSSLLLDTSAVGATMGLFKSGPNQVQVVLGTAGDLWQGTDDSASGITGNGLTTLTIDTSLFTGDFEIDGGSGGDPTPLTLTFHGTGANGPFPSISSDWGQAGTVGNIVVTGGAVALSGSTGLSASGALMVSSPITASGNLVLDAPELLLDASVTVDPSPAFVGLNENGNLSLDGSNITINAPVETAPIATTADLLAVLSDGLDDISINAAATLTLNAPVSTGQIGSMDQPVNVGPVSGEIDIVAGAVVGNAQGELSTGSAYGTVGGGGLGFASGAINITTSGDITLPAPVAISTGDAFANPDPITGGGGSADGGAIGLFAGGNICADGITAPLHLHFGQGEGSDVTGQLHAEPVGLNPNDELTLGSPNGANEFGSGNIYLACTGSLSVDMEGLYPHANAHQTIDIATTGDLLLRQFGFNSGPAQLSGDDISLASSGGILSLDVYEPNNAPIVDLGTGNLTLAADEINLTNGFYDMSSDFLATDAIQGTGSVLLQPATPGRNIAIGGDNTLDSALNLSDNDVAAFAPGFKSITIGRAADGTGTVDVLDNVTFGSPTTIYGGSISGQGLPTVTTTGAGILSEWANRVIGFSSQYQDPNYPYFSNPASSALGPPDTAAYGNFQTAWAPAAENGTQEYLEIGYLQPVYATGVTIQETDGNGFVYQVDLLDTDGNRHTVFTGPDNSQPGAPAGLDIAIPQTSYLVAGVQVYVNTDHDLNNREEIDAVQLQGVTPANDLTLHARTGSIGGAASTTNVYTNVFPPNTNPYAVPDLACYLPAGAHYSAQVRFSANVQDLDLGYYPVFTVLVDGTPLLTQVASTVDQNTGDGSVDLELDVPASDASLPALHSITVQLAPVYAMLISEQTVTTTMPGGGVNHPIGATAGGTLNLISDAGNGAGNIFVTSGHALTLQQNVFTTTGPGHNSIGLETTAGDITVPSSEPSVLINDLFLIAAGSVNLPIGLSLTAPALTLSADGALNLDLTQRYAATIGDMTLKSGTTCIGTSVQPIKLRVGGKLNLATVSTTGGDADIYVTAPAALVVGTISTGPGATVEITTTAGGITLAAANETSANVSLNSAGPVELFYPGSFQAQSFSISAAGSIEASNLSTGLNLPALLSQTNPSSVISGDGVLTAPDISLNAGGDISAALTGLPLFSDGDIAWSLGGVTLNASAAGDITIFSPGNDLKIASLTSTPGHNVTVGAGAIATSFSSGLTGDNVVLGTQPAPRIRRDLSFSSHLYVDYANSDLVMDLAPGSPLDFGDGSLTLSSQQIEFDGAAGSITGTGPLLLNAGEITRNGTGGGAGLNLTNSTLDVFAPGFSSITINCDSVTIAGDVTFACPITINGSSIDDPGANTITTSASTDLTLHATTAAIGGAAAPVFVNVGGKLNLSADAGGGQGDIFVTSKQALTLGQNVTLATGPDRDAVVLSTSAGGITVPASVTGNDDLTLQSAADLTIADGVTLSEASLNLNAGGALVTGPTTKLVTTSSDMDLTSSTAAIGTSSNPVIVRVAGKLNLTTKAPGGANGDINITSPGSVAINTITTGPDADTIHIGTTGSGGVVLAGNSTLNDNVTITSAGTVAIETGIDFQGQSIGINSTGSITNTGSSTTVNGGTVANGIIQALASVGSTPDPFGVSLASTNGSLGASGSPLSIEAGSGSQFTASSGGDQDISAANGGTVAINTDTADGQTIHIDGGSFDTTNNASISSGSTLEVGSAGTLDIGTNDITVNSVTQDGGQILSSGGHLNTGGVTATAGTINIHVFGIHISIPIIHINPSSGNTVTLAGQNTNSTPIAIGAGQVAVADDFNTTGPITINPGNGNTSQVTLANNSTPAAAGNVATVGTVGLSLPPDPAILETTGLSLGSGTTLNMGAMGPAAQTGYGQIIVDGAVSLNNPTLAYAFDGYTPSTGTVFDIIQNKGGSPISGTFSGLPEGTVFKAGAEYLRISYLGGASGHDVTLTVVDRPPTVTVITPSLAGGTLPAGTTSLQIGFGEDVIGAGQAANYQLQSAGPDGLLGTADDVNVPLTVSSADGTAGTTATLTFAVLADGLYRLTVKSAITDTSGTALAGGGDGNSGENYVADFVSTTADTVSYNSPNFTFSPLLDGFGAGELIGNPTAGYEALSHLQVSGTDYAPIGTSTPGSNPQDFLTATQTIAGLNVSRRLTVPTGGNQDFARTIEILQNATGSDITTTVAIITNLGTGAAANVFATSSADATPSANDQWVGTQEPGGPAIIHYIHGPTGLTPTAVSLTGDSIEWTYSITIPAGKTVELGEFGILNSTQAGAIADANALVGSTGFGGDAADFLSPTDLASLANFQFVTAPVADAGGPYTLKEGSALTLDASQSSAAAGYTLNYSWTINGQANAASGVNPTLTYAQLQALGISLGGTYDISVQVDDGLGGSATADTSLNVIVGDPVQLAFEPTANDAIAGKTMPSFNVDVLDQLGTLVSTDTSMVTVAITTPDGATFSAGTLSVAAGGGVATFSDLAIQQAGTYTLTASDGNLTQAVSGSFSISSDVAYQLAFEKTTNDAVADNTIPAFTVDVEDQYGNPVPGDTSTVAVAINSGPADGSIAAGTLSVGATAGVAAFGDLVIQKAGTYTLVATEGGLTQAISGSFTIGHDVASGLRFENTNNNAAAGQTIPAFKVDVLDQFGNPVPEDTSTVTIRLNSDTPGQQFASGTLSEPAAGGVATFSDLVIQGSGAFSLVATDGFLTPALSGAFTIAEPLAVIADPADQTAFAGQTATFTAASANSFDDVQWQVNQNDGNGFTDIAGATTTTLTLSDVTAAENGFEYQAVFSNAVLSGSLATSAATLTVDFVTSAPAGVTLNAGQTATFTAASSNPSSTDTVQWQVNKNDGNGFSNITGATAVTLTVSNTTASQDGYQYDAVFANSAYSGSLTTSAATLVVDHVTTNPSNVTVNAGQSAVFTAASSNPLGTDSVQWQVNKNDGNGFTNINGATNTTLTISSTTPAANGSEYEAVFSNTAYNGSLTTSAATLTVDYVTSNPSSVTVNAGQTATFTAASANPLGTDSVQWQVNKNDGHGFKNIGGATHATLTITNTTASETGYQYHAVVTNSGYGGALTTSPATLTVDHVTTNPSNVPVNVGQTATFTAASSNPLGTDVVQWQVNKNDGHGFGNISGASNTTLTISNATVSENAYQYQAVFTNSGYSGSLTTSAATLAVDYVTMSPGSVTVNPGQTATFTAASSNPLGTDTAQWQVNKNDGDGFSNIGGATHTTLTVSNTTASENGYEYEAVFSNTAYAGSLTTSAATLTVDHVTTNPSSVTLNAGQTATFTAASSNPLGTDAVQWQVNKNDGNGFGNIGGATHTTLTISNTTASENGYQYEAVFTNTGYGGSLTTTAAALTVDHVTTNPSNVTLNAGQTATFAAASSNPVGTDTVQWQVNKNDGRGFNNISGAANATLTISNSTASESGYQYQAVFTNSGYPGSLTTSAATLAVDHVTTSPGSVTVNGGQTATFTAASSNPLGTDAVQWQINKNDGHGFTNVNGGTHATLTVSTTTASENGYLYQAVFTNSAYGGSVTTGIATLTVDFVTANPSNVTLNAGQTATFMAASSNPPGTDFVQWQVNKNDGHGFNNISSATNATLTISNSTVSENGYQYQAVFTNSGYPGSLTTSPATLNVDHVTTSPDSASVTAFQTATFTAASSDPLGTDMVQWQVNKNDGNGFTNISGATTTILTISAATVSEDGYQYQALFTNSAYGGTLTSSAATLSVTKAMPTVTALATGGPFTGQPYSAGGTATGAGGAAVSGTFTFAYKDSQNNPLAGAPTPVGTYSVIATFTSADANYTDGVSLPLGFSITPGPSGPITTDKPTFAWSPVSGAKSYNFKITDGKNVVLSVTKLSKTTYALSSSHALTPGQTYSWSVTPLNSKGKAIGASSKFTFQVLPLGAPTAVSPTGSIPMDRPTFTWTAVTDAGHTSANRFTLAVTDTTSKHVLTITNLTGTSYTLTGAQALTPGHSFTWSVTAVSTNGKATAAGQSAAFTIAALTAPAGLVFTNANDTFSWQAVTDVGHYSLRVVDSVTGKVVVSVADVAGTTYHLTSKQAKALKHGRSYTWFVTAVSTNGQASVRSAGATFIF